MPPVVRLTGRIQDYAWGSTEDIPALLGREPDGSPCAELWLGAHPSAPSVVELEGGPLPLPDLIASDPVEQLGARGVATHGEQLPFLLKVLAAAKPLSLQVHPDAAQARAGYARDEASPSPVRNYHDPNHKPEMLCALTPFEALCGFREVDRTLEAVGALGGELLLGAYAPLADRGAVALPDTLSGLLSLSSERAGALAAEVVGSAAQLVSSEDPAEVRVAELVLSLAEHHPGDVGVVAALLLNHVTLAPGEAIYLDAGVPHAYLRGLGVEVMANSDNVLRCGLTPKHVDVDELLSVTRWHSGPVEVLRGERVGATRRYVPPVPEFSLTLVEVSDVPTALVSEGPGIVLVTEGSSVLTSGATSLTLSRGEAAWVPAGAPVALSGAGTTFLATTNASA